MCFGFDLDGLVSIVIARIATQFVAIYNIESRHCRILFCLKLWIALSLRSLQWRKGAKVCH
ncbi:hypothetical protein [Helicobacter sp. MIT 05-5294]|uniref:hypothetical protein n=1 Tax=Helicobacter sp. MIT 05-5294 TaxID=1548150 RepID=UPI000B1D8ECD|nr:hypothetical protein [Helicobacter sp. MIT 05-5294]TLD89226.1 hypothetical protein LS69_000945 [Helicobacter sp. MIT 05-5294]